MESGGRRVGAAACALAAALLVASGCSATPEPAPGDDASTDVLWQTDFDGPAGTRPDPAIWTTDLGNAEQDGWGNEELQSYTDLPENSSLDGDGHLVIAALPAPEGSDLPCATVPACPYTSARITTEGTVALEHGRVEVRARMPKGAGLLPAIWMLGENGLVWPAQGELDIAEVVGDQPEIVFGTAHGPTYFDEGGIGGAIALDAPAGDRFHVFAIDKQPERIVWSVDGTDYAWLTPGDLPDPDDWVFEQPMHLLLDVAVGGTWPGDPDAATRFPAALVVDSVRITGTGIATPRG